jgi:hypothetical protein
VQRWAPRTDLAQTVRIDLAQTVRLGTDLVKSAARAGKNVGPRRGSRRNGHLCPACILVVHKTPRPEAVGSAR